MPKPDRTPRRPMSINWPAGLHDALRRHAFERNVSMNRLVCDVMTLWVRAATDPNDPLFSAKALAFPLPELPENIYPDYLESLLFLVDDAA